MKTNDFSTSIRNKSSKFTLTKGNVNKSKQQSSNQKNNSLLKTIDISYPSKFAKFQLQKPKTVSKKKNNSLTKTKNIVTTSRCSSQVNKDKNDFLSINSLNKDFMFFFKKLKELNPSNNQINRTICNNNSLDKKKSQLFNNSVNNATKNNKDINKNHSITVKGSAIKVNTLYSYKEKVLINNTLPARSSSKNKELSVGFQKSKNVDKNDNGNNNNNNNKKSVKNYKPLQLKVNRPSISCSIPKKVNGNFKSKKTPITTYKLNMKKKKSSLEKNNNKTQEIKSKINKHKSFKNTNTSLYNIKNNFYVSCFNTDDNILSFREEDNDWNEEKEDEFNRKELVKVSDDENEDNSGILGYDEVKDIIVYYNLDEIDKKEDYLFEQREEDYFNLRRKNFYLNYFGLKEGNCNKVKNGSVANIVNKPIRTKKDIKSPSKKSFSKTKNTHSTVIKFDN